MRWCCPGYGIETADSFDLAAPIAEIWPVISQSGLAWLMSQHGDRDDLIGPALAEMARNGRRYSVRPTISRRSIPSRRSRAISTRCSSASISCSRPPPPPCRGRRRRSIRQTIDGQPVGPRGHAVFTPFANALGLPAISLPAAPSSGRLPIGFQLVAAQGRDADLLALARACERTPRRGGLAPDLP